MQAMITKEDASPGHHNVRAVTDLRFDEVAEQLHIEKIGVGEVWLLGTAAADEIQSVYRILLFEDVDQAVPLVTAGGTVQIVDQQQGRSGPRLCVVNFSKAPLVAEGVGYLKEVLGCGHYFDCLVDQCRAGSGARAQK